MSDTLMFAAIFVFSLAMVAGSFWVIYEHDRERRWDHTARTMTQLAIGAASVLVAVLLFTQQSKQQDARLFAQQANLSAAFLRSIVTALRQEGKQVLVLHTNAVEFACDRIGDCAPNEEDKRRYDNQLRQMQYAVEQPQTVRPIFFRDRRYIEQVRDLVRTSYVLGPEVVEYLLGAANRYNQTIARVERTLREAELPLLSLKLGVDSPKVTSQAFLKLAVAQQENVVGIIAFTCALEEISAFLSDPAFLGRAQPLMRRRSVDESDSCKPTEEPEFQLIVHWDGAYHPRSAGPNR